MSLVLTPAVVLRTYRYSETSKVVRLATRELGVQSAIAKGVFRPKSRFGAALQFLAEGEAQLYFRESRELHTLGAFDVQNLRQSLAGDVARFSAAAALAEVMLKTAPPAPLPAAYDAFVGLLDDLAGAAPEAIEAAGVRALWVLVAEVGFGPSLEACARDGTPIDHPRDPVVFSAAEGGVLCGRCAPREPPTKLPPTDYDALLALADRAQALPPLDPSHAAAHRRLVARFVRYHVGEALTALDSWERHTWAKASHAAS
ncbi:MAG TPA: DNA repair protein RecO [Gemmatimonadales bacterium]|nr:DNA repair protein RecO [Gemmatimonadales bacterium]